MKFLIFLLAFFVGFHTADACPIHKNETITIVLWMDDGNEKTIITTISTSPTAAEKVVKELDIEMAAPDAAFTEKAFAMTFHSPEQQNLAMKIFDEEGYELVEARTIKPNEGQSPKVEKLDGGVYIFEIQDTDGVLKTVKANIKRD